MIGIKYVSVSDDIIKLNRKKHVQTPNKVKEFRGRVGKKKIQGISPLNRRGLKVKLEFCSFFKYQYKI